MSVDKGGNSAYEREGWQALVQADTLNMLPVAALVATIKDLASRLLTLNSPPCYSRLSEFAPHEDAFDGTWTTSCACGWESEGRNAEADAIADARHHLGRTPPAP